jgi:hypothetical protein
MTPSALSYQLHDTISGVRGGARVRHRRHQSDAAYQGRDCRCLNFCRAAHSLIFHCQGLGSASRDAEQVLHLSIQNAAKALEFMEAIKPIPEPPKGLREAALKGTLIPFVGAGASRIAGCPNWSEFADGALRFFVEKAKFSHGQLAQISHL